MANVLHMTEINSLNELLEKNFGFFLFETCNLFYSLAEIAATAKFHYHVNIRVIFKYLMKFHHI